MDRKTNEELRLSSRAALGLLSVAVFGLVAVPLYAQVAGARIAGTVTDSTGAVIAGAQVTIKNTATNLTRELATNKSGFYSAPNLSPGFYRVTALAKGFKSEAVIGLTLTVGADIEVNLTMAIGTASENVQVQGAAPTVETNDATLGALVNGQTIRELPLNARDWTQLAALEPGVAQIRTQTTPADFLIRGNRGLGTQMTVSGGRQQQNNYRIDGVSINDYSNGGPGSALGIDLGVDAIQEFSVVTANAQADYGKTSGGVINAVTRQGTNTLHGSAYEFLRNSALDARNYFDPATIPPFRRNQFGAALGGPLKKDRTFFFGDYEGLRQDQSVTQLAVVPTQAARNGQLVAGTVTVSPLVEPYLALYPLPASNIKGDTGTFTSITQQIGNENFFTTRIDHNFSTTDLVHATYMFDDSTLTSPDLFQTVVSGTLARRQLVTAEYTKTLTPALLNSFRVGSSRVSADVIKPIKLLLPFAGDPSNGFVPGIPVGFIGVTGISNYTGGPGAGGEVKYGFNSIQVYDDLFWTKGMHSFKLGANVERLQDNELGTLKPNGVFNFTSLANFLIDQPAAFSAALTQEVAPYNIRQTIAGTYFEDDAHLASNFTVNLGLRYEMATVPTEVNGRLTNLRNITDATPHLGSPYFYNPTYRNFEPRIGFSWDPFHTGRTAFRGAFGVYDVLPLTYEFGNAAYSAAPFFQLATISSGLPPGSFPATAFTLLTPNQLRYEYIDSHPRRNYVMNWNLNVQQQFGSNLVATVAYVGSHGIHQPFQVQDMDIVLPTSHTSAGYFWPIPAGSGARVNPSAGQIIGLLWNGSSFYDALQTHIVRRMTKSLQFGASYTWAKSIDTSSASVAGNQFLNSIFNLPWFDTGVNRGLSDFDIRHNGVFNAIWQVPTPRDEGGMRWFVSGWQIGGIYQVSSGLPFTPIIGGDPLGLHTAYPFDFPDRIFGAGCESAINSGNPVHYIKTQCFSFPTPATRLGNAGRNSLIGPGLSNFDLSLFKNNHIKRISEDFNIQFRAEFFNVLNHTNLSSPIVNNNLYAASGAAVTTAGLITTTSTSSRQLQFALKIAW
ncbi:MAG: carboxypeptidase regulatory-like domain-containing protein [Terriglobales bacterium]